MKQVTQGCVPTKKKTKSFSLTPYLFLLPFIVIFAIFMIYPILNSLYLSFTSAQGNSMEWIGLENFQRVLSDEIFWKSVGNVFLFLIVQVPVMIILGCIIANALNYQHLKLKGLFRFFIFAPVLVDMVTYSIVFSIIFNERYGSFNQILQAFGLENIPWFTDPFWAKVLIVLALTWRWTGYNSIIILSGMQSIDNSLYESADLDGASAFTKFTKITIPLLKPVMLFCVITSTIGTINLYTEPSLLTRGGPVNATYTPIMYIYDYGFNSFNFGFASAAVYVLTTIVVIISAIQMFLTRDKEGEK